MACGEDKFCTAVGSVEICFTFSGAVVEAMEVLSLITVVTFLLLGVLVVVLVVEERGFRVEAKSFSCGKICVQWIVAGVCARLRLAVGRGKIIRPSKLAITSVFWKFIFRLSPDENISSLLCFIVMIRCDDL